MKIHQIHIATLFLCKPIPEHTIQFDVCSIIKSTLSGGGTKGREDHKRRWTREFVEGFPFKKIQLHRYFYTFEVDSELKRKTPSRI